MKPYVILLRGINVGGKNKVPMAELRKCLKGLGFSDVSTFIASGNAVLKSYKNPAEIQQIIETALPEEFKLDSEIVKVLVLGKKQLQSIIESKPNGFGEDGDYYDDVIFLMNLDMTEAMKVFNPREGVDMIWPGKAVIYSRRLGSMRTKSRLGKIIGTPPYKSMTIRTWNTAVKLLELVKGLDS